MSAGWWTHPLGRLMFLVGRSLRQHVLSTSVTMLSVALASGLVMACFAINAEAYDAFTGGTPGFDAVVGARGSELQLVLDTVFHLETSPGNIPWSIYQTLKRDPRVALAVPYAVGDNYKGYRIVGTTTDIFDKFEYQAGQHFSLEPAGRVFDPQRREAVLGCVVASRTGLKLNDHFNPYHGLDYDPNLKHADVYTVVGVMTPTGTPSDRVVWIPIDGIYRMAGHVLRGSGHQFTAVEGQPIPDEDKAVSAVMLKLKSPFYGFQLYQTINREGRVATMAWPIGKVMGDLFDKLGWMVELLTLVSGLVMLVASASILASVYNTVSERRRDFAIMRALGAPRQVLFLTVAAESAAISLLGACAGWIVYWIVFTATAAVVRVKTGVVLDVRSFHAVLLWTPLGATVLGVLAGILPGWRAEHTDVASNLTPLS